MGQIDDLSNDDAAWDELERRVAALESRDPLANSAVSGGRTRFIGENSFLIEGSGGVTGTLTIEGLEVVNGELRIVGELNVSGPTDLGGDTDVTGNFTVTGPTALNGKTTVNGDTTVEGPFRVRGPMGVYGNLGIHGDTDIDGETTVSGPFHVDGATDINGSLDIDGDTKLNGNLDVQPGGAVRVDDMTIGRIPGTSQAGILFGVGQLRSTGDRTVLQSGDAIVGVRSNQVALLFGSIGIEVYSTGAYLRGIPGPPSGTALFPVVTDSNGKLYRAPQSN